MKIALHALMLLLLTHPVLAAGTAVYPTLETKTRPCETNLTPTEVQRSKYAEECRPANEDADGHWGSAVEGFQLGLRLEKISFTNGEPIIARILLRNISDQPLTHLVFSVKDVEDSVRVSKGERQLKPNGSPGPTAKFSEVVRATRRGHMWHCSLPPRTQRAFEVDLRLVFDVTPNGQYTVFGERAIINADHTVITNVVSGKAEFTIAHGP